MYDVFCIKNYAYTRFHFVGKKIGELTHEKIKQSIINENWIHGIAMREGKMVLACRDTGVMLFNMN